MAQYNEKVVVIIFITTNCRPVKSIQIKINFSCVDVNKFIDKMIDLDRA